MNASILRLAALLSSAAMAACSKGDQSSQANADSTTSVATTPATPMQGNDRPLPSATRSARSSAPAAAPAKPNGPSSYTAPAGAFLDVAVNDTVTSKTAKVGDAFTGTVVSNVSDGHGAIVIPQGSVVHGSVTEASSGSMTLAA